MCPVLSRESLNLEQIWCDFNWMWEGQGCLMLLKMWYKNSINGNELFLDSVMSL